MFAKLKTLLIAWSFFFIAVNANAESLIPLEVGTVCEYIKSYESDPDNTWTMRAEILEEVFLGSENYFHLRISNYSPGQIDDRFVRSTEDAFYSWNGTEVMIWQTGPVGTTWEYIEDPTKPTEITIVEIVASAETVSVPYGEPDDNPFYAYHFRKSQPSSQNPNAVWHEYVVPGLALIMEVDYWTDNGPTIEKLVQIVPEPCTLTLAALGLLGLLAVRARRR